MQTSSFRTFTVALAVTFFGPHLSAFPAMAKPAPASVLLPDPPPESGQAIVYIHRPAGLLWAVPATFSIDGEPVVRLKTKQCAAILVTAGPHTLTQTWPYEEDKAIGYNVVWEKGRSYHYELMVKQRSESLTLDVRHWYLTQFSAAARRRLLTCTSVPAMRTVGPRPKPSQPEDIAP